MGSEATNSTLKPGATLNWARDSAGVKTGTTPGDHFFQFKDEIISFSFALSPFWENSKLVGNVNNYKLNGIVIDKNQINLAKPIKELGIYKIIVSLHPEIFSKITINVARTDEEAKLQERGKGSDFTDTESSKNEEDKVEIDKMFDDVSLASKINNDNKTSMNEDVSDGTSNQNEKNEQKLDAPDALPEPESKNILK